MLALILLTQVAVAASLSGKWNFVFYTEDSEYPKTIVLTTQGDHVTAKIADTVLEGTYKDGKLELTGDYYAEEAGYKAMLKLSGKLAGDQIKGNATWDYYQLTFTANRAK